MPHLVVGGHIWCAATQNHSVKEVSAYIIWYRVHTWGLQGKCHKFLFCALLCTFTNRYTC